MRSFAILCTLLLTAVTASPNPQASVVAGPGTLGLGATCSSNQQCANGASCYGVNSFIIPTCGSFQAECQTDSQCATNNCNQGFCNGFLPPSSYRISKSSTPTVTPSLSSMTSTAGLSSVTTAAGSLGLGVVCSSDVQCANGATCYGVTSFTIRTCGSFQATCQTDSQCATNNCNQGFCNGYLPPNSYRISQSSTPTAIASPSSITSTPGPPSSTAAAGSLGLGVVCSADVQCANGASCYGVTSFTIRTCGSFQAVCKTDSQCATNTCNQGFCNGYLSPSSYRITPTSIISSTQGRNSSTTATAPPRPAFTGAASKLMSGWSFAIVCLLVALVL